MLGTILHSTANVKNKQTILCTCKKTQITHIKRYMLTMRSVLLHEGTKLIKPYSATSLQGSIRNLPNEYSQGHLDFDVRTGNNHKVPNHEINHGIIRRNRDTELLLVYLQVSLKQLLTLY